MAARTLSAVRSDRVAQYATVDGALRAATHLIELHYDPRAVAIAPRGYRVVRPDGLLARIGRGMQTGAVVATIGFAFLWVLATVGIADLVRSLAPALVLAAAAGAVIGVVAGFVQHRRANTMTWGVERPEMEPTSFDVVVDGDTAQANHDLAGWWDPAAPPARWQRSA